MTERAAILGTGLIGGSVGLGLAAARPELALVGYDPDPGSASAALDRGAVTNVAATPEDAVVGAGLVVLAPPVDQIAGLCERLRERVGGDTVVTDVGSAKAHVVVAGERAFGDRFVGGHPMAGSERHGIEAADGGLFEDSWWILTPTPSTAAGAYAVVSDLAQALHARPVAVEPTLHDALVARVSHVPQLTASALMDAAWSFGDRQALLGLAAGGFRDVTRIAASSPDMWVAILRANRAAVLDALGNLRQRLDHLGTLLAEERWADIESFLSRARRARAGLFSRAEYAGDPVALSILVPDRPGVLAEVTTAAGELGANIEDLRIVHSTEGGRGRLELVVAGHEAAELLVGALLERGYRAERAPLQ
jgi:prephenate dehydrogenase